MLINKFYDVKYNPQFPWCIEIMSNNDGFIEVDECLWFATEKEQLEEFNTLLKDYEEYFY